MNAGPELGSSSGLPMPPLVGVPPAAQLVLRDLIRGLEAEAGTARALARRADRAREHDHDRFALHLAGLRDQADRLRAELAETRSALAAAQIEVAALSAELSRRRGPRR